MGFILYYLSFLPHRVNRWCHSCAGLIFVNVLSFIVIKQKVKSLGSLSMLNWPVCSSVLSPTENICCIIKHKKYPGLILRDCS